MFLDTEIKDSYIASRMYIELAMSGEIIKHGSLHRRSRPTSMSDRYALNLGTRSSVDLLSNLLSNA